MHQRLIPPPLTRATTVAWIGGLALLVAALLFGGATREGFLLHAALRLIALALLLVIVWRAPPVWTSRSRWPLLLLAGALAVPLAQLIPLPPSLWVALPGRETFMAAYEAAGIPAPWLPVSLAPQATWNGALSLLAPAAMFVAALGMDTPQRRAVLPWILAVAAASILLGVGQVAEGPASALRPYEVTNASAAVGFFANRNHQASLLVAVLPLAAAWTLSLAQRGGSWLLTVVGFGLALVFATGVGVSESRAGVLLLALAGVGCLALVARAGRLKLSARTLAAAVLLLALGLIPALAFGLAEIVRQAPEALADDPRAQAFPRIFAAAMDYLPLGSGLGTFDPVYRMLETPQTVTNAFLNHAHNDYLELLLETGVLGPALIAGFLVWFAAASLRAWRGPGASQTAGLARAASLSILLLLAHSLVDYPLRTAALATLFAFLCACLVEPHGPRRVAAPARQDEAAEPQEA